MKLILQNNLELSVGASCSTLIDNSGKEQDASWGYYLFLDDAQTLFKRIPTVHVKRVFDLPAFNSINTNRCLVLIKSIVITKREGGKSKEYWIEKSNGGVFSIAGIWERIVAKGEKVNTFLLITYNADNEFSSYIRHMPLILESCYEYTWLNYALPAEQVPELIFPPEQGFLTISPL